jgi:acyl-CoA synthetase (AMP-forming)/AMP-acid ligase II
MMLGYADQAQNAAAFDTEGFFKTGDIGKLLPSGAILITDRKKDIIIRGGENLSAREIEEAILQHPAILEAAVVAAPHARLGEGVAAFVVTHSNDDVALDDVLELLSEMKLAKQKWPQYLSVERVLPKTASGKVQKELLRRQLRDNGVQL